MTHRTGMDFGFQQFSRDRFRPEKIIGATLILGTLPFLFDPGVSIRDKDSLDGDVSCCVWYLPERKGNTQVSWERGLAERGYLGRWKSPAVPSDLCHVSGFLGPYNTNHRVCSTEWTKREPPERERKKKKGKKKGNPLKGNNTCPVWIDFQISEEEL